MSKYKFLIFLFVLLGCKFSNEYENRSSDKDDAEKITKVLYEHIRNNDFEPVLDLFGDEFYKKTSEEDLINNLKSMSEEYGQLNKTELVGWESFVSTGSNNSGLYVLTYKCTSETIVTNQIVTMKLNDVGEIKIVGYQVLDWEEDQPEKSV